MMRRASAWTAAIAAWVAAAVAGGCEATAPPAGGGDAGIGTDGVVFEGADLPVQDGPDPGDAAPTPDGGTGADVEPPKDGEFGAPCLSNSDCESGFCVPGPGGDVCTKACTDFCPQGYECKGVTVGTETVFLCVPPTEELCRPCAVDVQCPGGACLVLDGDGRCVSPCEGDEGCPSGYACLADAEGAHEGLFCQPKTGSCTCNAYTNAGIRTCQRKTEHGTCFGVQICKNASGWEGCTAPLPAAETCNGLDDDCNGLLDDELPVDEACEVTVEGVGSCPGVNVCLGTPGWLCQAKTPAPESCNAADDDCDGAADEDFRDEAGAFTLDAHCGYCGNDCTGKIAHGTATCGGAPEAPVCVVESCDEGYVQVSAFQCLPPIDVTCAACATDADCLGGSCVALDGQSVCLIPCGKEGACPKGFACGDLEPGLERCLPATGTCTCTPASAGAVRTCKGENAAGVCFGTETCDPAFGWVGCTAKTPLPEACNGLDDDCDGLVDDGAAPPLEPCESSNEHGTCAGAWFCATKGGETAWLCNVETPAAETCDYADDDCDGAVDEGFTAAPGGPYVHDLHCAACGVACTTAIPHAEAGCALGPGGVPACEVLSCDPGFYQSGPLTCLPAEDDLCAPCSSNADCGIPGDVCLALGDGGFCGRDCGEGNLHGEAAGVCPSGYACVLADGGSMQCAPASGTCSCLPGDAGESRPCLVANESGTCFGTETCDPAAGWVGCTAKTPAPEVCNGQDDDCSSAVDDVPGRGAPCSFENAAGSCAGTMDCVPGNPALVCAAKTPAAETCDLQDDDCDGETDEDFPSLGTVCLVGKGICERAGVHHCTPGGLGTACSVEPGEPEDAETCNGFDDDCNGLVDDGYEAPLCPLQKGVCEGAKATCAGAAGLKGCDLGSYGAGYEVSETTCDGLDNDCDGGTDEVDLDHDGHVAEACGGDDCDDLNPLVHAAAKETCGDSLDNDCNGTVDDKDADGDDHVDESCVAYPGPLPKDDCKDTSALAQPGLDEVCGDGLDNDCDGSVDDVDLDGDGFLADTCGGTDCDDGEFTVHPGSLEVCDGLDNDCGGEDDDKDADADGHVDVACLLYTGAEPRDDCDDANVGVNPDMDEVCGNALDEDCSGAADDKDVDRDGAVDTDPLCGGDDCVDHDPTIFPGAPEVRDGKDNDCDPDGKADEGLLAAGAVVVTEIMYDPAGTPDENFEWFEVWNPGDRPVNLRTWLLRDVPGSAQEVAVVDDDVLVPPRGFAVLCRTGVAAYNGGVACDDEYGFMQLGNTDDELVLDFDGVVVDEVAYHEDLGWPVATTGSLNLDPDSFGASNAVPGAWCNSPAGPEIPSGDEATPGASNVSCTLSVTLPQATSVHPSSGVAAGGTLVLVRGAGFEGTTDVRIGGVSCTEWSVESDHEIACVVPAGPAGIAAVTVHEGATTETLAAAFTRTKDPGAPAPAELKVLGPAALDFVRGRWAEALRVEVRVPGTTGGGCPTGREYAPGTLKLEVGFGPLASDPRSSGAWTWFPAFCETSPAAPPATAGGDVFLGTVTTAVPVKASWTFRASRDGGLSWSYADLDGLATPLVPPALPTLTVL